MFLGGKKALLILLLYGRNFCWMLFTMPRILLMFTLVYSTSGQNGVISSGGGYGAKGASPFSAAMGIGGHGSSSVNSLRLGSKPFSGAMAGGSGNVGPFSGASGGTTGSSSFSPFSSSSGGDSSGSSGSGGASSPFASAMAGGGGNPFQVATGTETDREIGNGASGPFSASNLAGVAGGPGGLTGGDFQTGKTDLFMGHDFSKDMMGSSGSSTIGEKPGSNVERQGEGQYGTDRFDTSQYQQMVNTLFQPGTVTEQLQTLKAPFDGKEFVRPKGQGPGRGQGHYDTGHQSSLGSFASTDLNFSANLKQGTDTVIGNPFSTNSNYGKSGSGGSSGSGATAFSNGGRNGINPFNTSKYNSNGSDKFGSLYSGGSSPSRDGTSGLNPFDTSKFNTMGSNFNPSASQGFSGRGGGSKSPYDTSKYNAGNGGNPFDTSMFTTENGANPFDTSKFSTAGNFGMSFGNSGGSSHQKYDGEYQGTDSNGLDIYGNVDFAKLSEISGNKLEAGAGHHDSSYGKDKGLDEYGNVNFAKLSGLSGNELGAGSGSPYSDLGSSNGYQGYGGSFSASFSSSTSSLGQVLGNGQYKTPFNSDNYNQLIGNPFDSSSNFNGNHENYKQPFDTAASTGLALGSFGSSSVSSENSGYAMSGGYGAGGPGGDPFNQGGVHMKMGNIRGRRSGSVA